MNFTMRFIKNTKILLILAGFSSFAQTIVLTGKITYTINTPLAYANILAIPESDSEEVRLENGKSLLKC